MFNFNLKIIPPPQEKKDKITVAITPSPNNSAFIELNCASWSNYFSL